MPKDRNAIGLLPAKWLFRINLRNCFQITLCSLYNWFKKRGEFDVRSAKLIVWDILFPRRPNGFGPSGQDLLAWVRAGVVAAMQ